MITTNSYYKYSVHFIAAKILKFKVMTEEIVYNYKYLVAIHISILVCLIAYYGNCYLFSNDNRNWKLYVSYALLSFIT